MVGRKKKVPPGYIPQWNTDIEDSDFDIDIEQERRLKKFRPDRLQGSAENEGEVQDDPEPRPPDRNSIEPPDRTSVEPPDRISVELQASFYIEPPVEVHDSGSTIHPSTMSFEVHDSGSVSPPGEMSVEVLDFGSSSPRVDSDELPDIWSNEENELPLLEDDVLPDHQEPEQEDQNDEDDCNEEEFELLWSNSEDENQEEDKESFKYVLRKFSEDWIVTEVDHKVSKIGTSEFWNTARKWMFALTSAFIKEKKTKFPKFEHIRRKLVKTNVPRISMDTGYVDKNTNELIVAADTEKNPVSEFPPDKYRKVYEIASVKVYTYITL